ncbi:MAG: hypothetical protein NT010_04045 [Proteobacteria bacterium]|nr:hypothetical protein [Pseudomonadota bacterium]
MKDRNIFVYLIVMRTIFAIVAFIIAAWAFFYGFITEWRQSRANGPIAIVATLPFAVESAMLAVLGLSISPWIFPLWVYPLIFVALLVLLCSLIMLAGARRREVR